MFQAKLDIVLPCFNPIDGWEKNLVSNINRLKELLPAVEFFIYLVNDGSARGLNPEKISFLQTKIPNFNFLQYSQNQGKGNALRHGVSATTHELVIYTDIDFPYTEDSFTAIYQTLASGKTDVAVGVRSERYYEKVPASRVKISKALRFFAQKLLHLPVNDTQAGLKGFNRAGREIFLKSSIKRYLFDLEFIFMAANAGLKVVPVEVTLKPGIVFSKMNAKILLAESYNFLKFVLTKPSATLEN
jgi:glycosyltransferase involved in cell wall biosynthesis